MSDSEGDSSHSLISNVEAEEWVVVRTPLTSDSEQHDTEPVLSQFEYDERQTGSADVLFEDVKDSPGDIRPNDHIAQSDSLRSAPNFSVFYNANHETAVIKSLKVVDPGCSDREVCLLSEGLFKSNGLHSYGFNFKVNWKCFLYVASTCVLGRLLASSKSRLHHLNVDLSVKDAEIIQLKGEKGLFIGDNEKFGQGVETNGFEQTRELSSSKRNTSTCCANSAIVNYNQWKKSIADWTMKIFGLSDTNNEQQSDSSLKNTRGTCNEKKDENGRENSRKCSSGKQTWRKVVSDWARDVLPRINEQIKLSTNLSSQLSSASNDSTWKSLINGYSALKSKAGQSASQILQDMHKSSKLARNMVNESLWGLHKLRDVLFNATKSAENYSRRVFYHLEPTKRLEKLTEFYRNVLNESVSNLQRFYDLLTDHSMNYSIEPIADTEEILTDENTDSWNVEDRVLPQNGTIEFRDKSRSYDHEDLHNPKKRLSHTESISLDRASCTVQSSMLIGKGAKILRRALKSARFDQFFDTEAKTEYQYYLTRLKKLSKQYRSNRSKQALDLQDTLWWSCQIKWWANSLGNLPPCPYEYVLQCRVTIVDCQAFMAQWQKMDGYISWMGNLKSQNLFHKSPDLQRAIHTLCSNAGKKQNRKKTPDEAENMLIKRVCLNYLVFRSFNDSYAKYMPIHPDLYASQCAPVLSSGKLAAVRVRRIRRIIDKYNG